MKIAILGAGAYGTALGQILTENGYGVEYYDPMLPETSLEKALDGAEIMLLAVPSAALQNILPKLPKKLPMIVATKGILDMKILDGFEYVMALSGPGFADDIKAHKPTLLTASDANIVIMFMTKWLTFDRSDDVKGILMCGALKNVYAVLAGLLDLKPGTLEHEQFLEEAAWEMRKILEANKADPDTVGLACGRGDLRLTCGAPSRNYQFGQCLRRDAKSCPVQTTEGATILSRIKAGEIVVPRAAKLLRELIKRSKEWS